MDELVKRLREFASIPEHCENVASCDQCSKESICLSFTNKRIIEVATQAADAIEELSKRVPPVPHGRLIDADALAVHKFAGAEHDISIADGGACYRRGWNDAIEAIMENAETITGGE